MVHNWSKEEPSSPYYWRQCQAFLATACGGDNGLIDGGYCLDAIDCVGDSVRAEDHGYAGNPVTYLKARLIDVREI